MKELHQWTRASGKRPVRVDGRPASSTRPSTWSSFTSVQAGAGDGFGVMCGHGLAVIDLDGCIDEDGSLSDLAREVLDAHSDNYVERSISGQGLHVFGYRPPGRGIARPGFEVYSRARFIRVTGDCYQPGGIEPLAVRKEWLDAGACA